MQGLGVLSVRGLAKTVAVMAFAISVSAAGQDLSPRIDHVAVKQIKRGEPFVVRALITSVTGKPIFEPLLYLRLSGFSGFTHVPMKPDPQMKDVFEARVPAEDVTGDFAYYLETFDADGNGPGRIGSAQSPLMVTVVAPPVVDRPVAPVEVKPPPPPTIVVMQAPPEPPHRSHVAPALLGVFGGLFAVATAGAGVLFNIESNNFNKAVNNNNAFSNGNYKTGQYMGYAVEGGIPISVLLIAGAFVTGLWPDSEKPPAGPVGTPVTVLTQPAAPAPAPQATPAPAAPPPAAAAQPTAKPIPKPAQKSPPPSPPNEKKEKDPFED